MLNSAGLKSFPDSDQTASFIVRWFAHSLHFAYFSSFSSNFAILSNPIIDLGHRQFYSISHICLQIDQATSSFYWAIIVIDCESSLSDNLHSLASWPLASLVECAYLMSFWRYLRHFEAFWDCYGFSYSYSTLHLRLQSSAVSSSRSIDLIEATWSSHQASLNWLLLNVVHEVDVYLLLLMCFSTT